MKEQKRMGKNRWVLLFLLLLLTACGSLNSHLHLYSGKGGLLYLSGISGV